ncbi:hypothetical protein D1816_01260 [Aquimarina sp. AD10]|uniref:Uncharacterized protein n=1 Tax=Aquimarina aggregata TaxID=1642818 RepID=A0A163BM07_9FLAO|nr:MULTISPECIES: hypothetical protein [Aquimarina]AXT59034.1 hypothetical protein D1816_01260 [Aquimarina sp. AD10]KZS41532.1 hypothetical protein AWE51_21230 [Aquimarina aggregata]RKM91382.1 hypothetical protein D7033_22150 [Aquimarina sp. AD10]
MNSYSFSSKSIKPPPTSKNNNQQLDTDNNKEPKKSKNKYYVLLMLIIALFLVGLYLCIAGLFLYRSSNDNLDTSYKSNLTMSSKQYLNVYETKIDLGTKKRKDFLVKINRS